MVERLARRAGPAWAEIGGAGGGATEGGAGRRSEERRPREGWAARPPEAKAARPRVAARAQRGARARGEVPAMQEQPARAARPETARVVARAPAARAAAARGERRPVAQPPGNPVSFFSSNVVGVASGQCLGVVGASTANNAPVEHRSLQRLGVPVVDGRAGCFGSCHADQRRQRQVPRRHGLLQRSRHDPAAVQLQRERQSEVAGDRHRQPEARHPVEVERPRRGRSRRRASRPERPWSRPPGPPPRVSSGRPRPIRRTVDLATSINPATRRASRRTARFARSTAAYSGKLYQVRRASDNTTKDIPALGRGRICQHLRCKTRSARARPAPSRSFTTSPRNTTTSRSRRR